MMKPITRYVGLCCLLGTLCARAQLVDNFLFTVTDGEIPDRDDAGISDTRSVTTAITAIGDLNVTLNIAGNGGSAFNGDLYVTLTHDSGYSVLLNRVGRRTGVQGLNGYADNGLNVTLDDHADVDPLGNGDIHTYRLTLGGSHTTALASPPLTGTWSPDARALDPDFVLDTSARTKFLSDFNGLDPNGNWTLFLADVALGGTARLVDWGLVITAVPEPADYATGAAAGLLAFAVWRRRRKILAGCIVSETGSDAPGAAAGPRQSRLSVDRRNPGGPR